MVDDKDFQKRIQRIGGLVQDLEAIADPAARAAAKELVQLLMDLHGASLERMLEVVFHAEGSELIEKFAEDPLVSSLLILYGLHPEDLQTRVERKLKQIQSKLNKMGAEVTSIGVDGSNIRLRVKTEAHSCGSTARLVQATVEEAIYEAAPDLASLVVEGLEEPAATGFVGIETLLGSSIPAHHTPLLSSEGMD